MGWGTWTPIFPNTWCIWTGITNICREFDLTKTSKSKFPGVCPGGISRFRFDSRIKWLTIYLRGCSFADSVINQLCGSGEQSQSPQNRLALDRQSKIIKTVFRAHQDRAHALSHVRVHAWPPLRLNSLWSCAYLYILILHCDGQVYKFHTIFNKRFKIYEHVNNHNFYYKLKTGNKTTKASADTKQHNFMYTMFNR
jgi:hypothetical protein